MHARALAQEQSPPLAQPSGPVNVSINLDGLATLIWQSFVAHVGDLGNAVWANLLPSLPSVAGQVLVLAKDALHTAAAATWTGVWGSSPTSSPKSPPI